MASIPTSVRVARWAAIAAIITAFGSIFNTIWSNTPWWEKDEPAAIVAPVETPIKSIVQTTPFVVEATKIHKQPIIHVKAIGWDVWALVVSIVIIMGATAREIVHQINNRRK